MLKLLGQPSVTLNADSLPWPRTRPGALLAYLAYRHDWVGREELALLLRPDVPDAEARRYLRQVIHRAGSFPWVQGLEVAENRLRWRVASDVTALRVALASDDAVAIMAVADGHAPAPLLEGYTPPGVPAFDDWLELEREQLASDWRTAVLRHAHAWEVAGDTMAAITARERVLAVAPLEEATLQALMQACLRAGLNERAVGAFERFASRLAREVGVQPLEATLALADAARRTRIAVPPSAERGSGAAVDVPRPSTAFVGRASELARACAWLEGGARLVTVVGLGGVGKTRLALELAQRLAPRFAAGVRFVPLEGLARVNEVVPALASRLGLAASGEPTVAAIAAQLGEGSALLVLDEAEHLPADALGSLLVRLVEAAPGLRLLVTARAPLGLASEHVLQLEGLPTGSPAAGIDEACRLFFDRAARAGAVLVADDDTTHAVRALCDELGGLPLAIELAAARAPTLPVQALLDELRAGADVLWTDATDVPSRHRSVQRLVRQAWDALEPAARSVLQRLAVFTSTFSLEAAERVADADLATVLTLLRRSLLRRVGDDRFELHALVKRAASRPPDAASRDAHARFVLAWLAERTPDLIGGDAQLQVLAQVHAELADIRQAWEWSVQQRATGQLEAAVQPLEYALHARSLWDVAEALFGVGVAAFGGETGPPDDDPALQLWARLQVRFANVVRQRSRTEEARTLLVTVLTRMGRRALDPRRRDATVLCDTVRLQLEARLELAKLDESVRAYVSAEQGYRAVLAAGTPGRDDDLVGQAHAGMGNVAFNVGGDLDEAMEHYEAAVMVARRLRDRDLLSVALINIGAGHHDLGRYAAARRSWREAAELAAALGHRQRQAVVLNNLAAASETLGDHTAARAAYERSLALRHELGDRLGAARVLLNLGRLAQRNGALEEADAYVEASVRAYELVDDPADLAWALATHARIQVALADLRSARRATERALRLGRLAGDRVGMLAGLLAAAAVQRHEGHEARAVELTRIVLAQTAGRDMGLHASAQALLAELDAGAEPDRAATQDLEQAVVMALDTLVDLPSALTATDR